MFHQSPTENTSSGRSSITPGTWKRIARSLHKAQLIDAWRLFHQKERDYTFYSMPHKLYLRIDYFLLPHSQLHAIPESSIVSIAWSDHAPVLLSYALTDNFTSKSRIWRLNESLLQEEEVRKDVVGELDCFFQTNDTPDSNPGIVWEAHKVVICGVLIKHGSRIKRQHTAQMASLTDLMLAEARNKHALTPSFWR